MYKTETLTKMAYRHNNAFHKQKHRAHTLRKVAFFLVFFAVIAVGVIAVDFVLNRLSNNNTVVSRETTTSVQSANVSVYRTEFFQFQAPDDWVLVENQSTDTKFVYVKNNNTLITQRLIVYVNRDDVSREADLKITNVLPVELAGTGNFIPQDDVSEHCVKSWEKGAGRNPTRIVHENVSFVCAPDSQQYNVVVGEVGNSEDIEVELNDGRKVTLAIVYSDFTAYPGPGDIYNIVSSFNTL